MELLGCGCCCIAGIVNALEDGGKFNCRRSISVILEVEATQLSMWRTHAH